MILPIILLTGWNFTLQLFEPVEHDVDARQRLALFVFDENKAFAVRRDLPELANSSGKVLPLKKQLRPPGLEGWLKRNFDCHHFRAIAIDDFTACL